MLRLCNSMRGEGRIGCPGNSKQTDEFLANRYITSCRGVPAAPATHCVVVKV
jgi:hypothetical protein